MGRETCRNIARRRLAHKTHVLHIWNRIWQQTAMAAISRHLTLSGENCAGAHYRLTPNWKSSSCTCSRYLYSAVLFLNAAARACLLSNFESSTHACEQCNTGEHRHNLLRCLPDRGGGSEYDLQANRRMEGPPRSPRDFR